MSTPELRAEHVAVDDAPDESRDDVVREDVEEVLPELPETDEAGSDRSPDLPHELDRTVLLRRIRSSRKLPKGLRDRLCEFVETLQFSKDAEHVPAVPVAEAVTMIEAAIPEHLQFDGDKLESPAHPRGENFFTGAGDAISDEDAERIAAEQLKATGFGTRT